MSTNQLSIYVVVGYLTLARPKVQSEALFSCPPHSWVRNDSPTAATSQSWGPKNGSNAIIWGCSLVCSDKCILSVWYMTVHDVM